MATPNKHPKTMSNRLLTMKFMQRASSSSPSTPSTPAEPPSKRQRLNGGSTRATPTATNRTDAQIVQDALAAEEQKRQDALEREAADRGETKWYLSFKDQQTSQTESPLRIVSAGYSSIDATSKARNEESSEEELAEHDIRAKATGRRSFGKFNRMVEKQQNPDLSSSDSDSADLQDEDESEVSDDPTGASAMITQARREAGEAARKERKAKRKAEKADMGKLANDRRKKAIKMNDKFPISGGISSGGGRGGLAGLNNMICHGCGGKGHMKRDCPNSKGGDSMRR